MSDYAEAPWSKTILTFTQQADHAATRAVRVSCTSVTGITSNSETLLTFAQHSEPSMMIGKNVSKHGGLRGAPLKLLLGATRVA